MVAYVQILNIQLLWSRLGEQLPSL